MTPYWMLSAVCALTVTAQSTPDNRRLRGSAMRNDDVSSQPSSTAFGPFEKLLGTWEGTRGINVVSLPEFVAEASGSANFMVLGHEYNETLTFTPIMGQVLNRGYSHANQLNPVAQLNQVLIGVTYHLRVVDSATGELLHVENGQWLWNKVPGVDQQWTVSRAAIIPHGVSLVALGHNSTMSGKEAQTEMEAMKSSSDWMAEPQNLGFSQMGYFEGQLAMGCNSKDGSPSRADCMNPVGRLLEDIGPVQSMNVTKLQVTSLLDGASLAMLPNIKAQVANKAFNATFWLESITDEQGQTYEQLQYAQNVFLTFETNFACRQQPLLSSCSFSNSLILWPHIQVNTMRKVANDPMAAALREFPYIR